MRALLGLIWNSGSRRESVEREIERVYVWVQGYAWFDARLGVNVLGNSPAFDGSRSVPVFVRRSPPNTPGWWYSSHFWLPATPSLFHAWPVDSRIRCPTTCYCPEFAREANIKLKIIKILMTSFLGSSSFEGVKISLFSIFIIVGTVAMIGVKRRE
jgi:hypothetical protein